MVLRDFSTYNSSHTNPVELLFDFAISDGEGVNANLVLEEDLIAAVDHNRTGQVKESAEETDDAACLASEGLKSHLFVF